MLIRPFQPEDDTAIEHILQTLWSHAPDMLALYRIHRDWQTPDSLLRQTLVASVDERIVGTGTIFESSLHPRFLMTAIHVLPDYQRQGIGTALYDALRQQADDRPWLVRLIRQDTAGVQFFQKRGYRVAISTLTGQLDPSDPAVQDWMQTLPSRLPGLKILPCDSTEASVEDIARIHSQLYRQFHAWNPPVEQTVKQAIARFTGDNIIEGSQWCVYQDDNLVGAAHFIENPFVEDANDAYLVYIGVLEHIPQADRATAALLRHLLNVAKEKHLTVTFEADTAHQPHYNLYQKAPATDTNSDFIIMTGI